MLKSFAVFLFVSTGLAGNAIAGPAGAPQDPGVIVKQVETFLRAQASAYQGSIQITVDASRASKQASCRDAQVFLPSGQHLRSRVSVGIRCSAPQPWVAYVEADLSINGLYYVAKHNIKPGAALSADDLTTRTGDLLALSPNVVVDPGQLIGHIATQRIRADMPIKASALRQPDSIQRGETVRLVAKGDGFEATSQGQAMQGGAPGAQIQVRTGSGQIVSGTIMPAHTVQVVM